jgi:hypothetical protein
MVVKGYEVVGTKVQSERWGQVNHDRNNQSIARVRLALAVRPIDAGVDPLSIRLVSKGAWRIRRVRRYLKMSDGLTDSRASGTAA